MGLVLITPPEDEPVVPTEVIQHLRLGEDTDEDDLLAGLTIAAREVVEAQTGRALMTQTWELTLDQFPSCNGVIRLPRPPLQSVTSVKYIDTAGVEQTLSTSAYQVDTASLVGRLVPAYGSSWPATRCQPNAVTVRFVAGYGDAAAVPAAIKAAMKLLIGNLYENREAVVTGTIVAELPFAVKALLGPHTVIEFA